MEKKLVKLIKLSDDVYNGNHPNGIYAGIECIGHLQSTKPTVGKRYRFIGLTMGDCLLTSIVTEILENNKFKTENSTYQLVEINIVKNIKK